MGVSTIATRSRGRVAASIVIGGFAAATVLTVSLPAAAAASCQPGSGPHLAGRHLTSSAIGQYTSGKLRCADLTGADLSGLSLIQMDLTGAILRGARLQHADLTQATLASADLTGADLTGASMGQVSAQGARFHDANLSHADLTQADLTDADLTGATLSGTDFTQATLDHANFTGATGLTPWSAYLLMAAGVVFALLALGSVRRSLRRSGGFPVTIGRRAAGLIGGLIGAIVVAIGFHLFAGGILGQIASAAGPPVTQTCSGPTCAVGVASGFVGLFVGIFVIIVGFAVRARTAPRIPAGGSAAWAGGGPFNPSPGGPFGMPYDPGAAGGFNPGGFNQGGFNQGGFNQGGFNQGGFNPGGQAGQGGPFDSPPPQS